MLEKLKSILGDSADIVCRDIFVLSKPEIKITLLFVDGMVSQSVVSEYVLSPLLFGDHFEKARTVSDVFSIIEHSGIQFATQKKETNADDAASLLLSGFCALLSEEINFAFLFETKGFERRSTAPPDENVVKGAKDSFIEVVRMNTALVRRKLKTPDLMVEETEVGTKGKTTVSVLYLKSVAKPELVGQIKDRLQKFRSPYLLSLGMIEEQLRKSKTSLFPQFVTTERVDKFCLNLAAGRVGVLIDGFPVSYIFPGEIKEFLESPEDYSENWSIASFVRILRYFLVFAGIFLPGLYIAILSYNPELLPLKFALSIKQAKAGVPFPAFLEVLAVMLSFEILIEAGIRLPKPVGQIVSIVGGLIVGDAAVSARIVSPVVVIVAALAAIASYAMPGPDFGIAMRMLNFLCVGAATLFGLLGVLFTFVLLLFFLSGSESYDVPYLYPFVGRVRENVKISDILLRLPFRFRGRYPFPDGEKKRSEDK